MPSSPHKVHRSSTPRSPGARGSHGGGHHVHQASHHGSHHNGATSSSSHDGDAFLRVFALAAAAVIFTTVAGVVADLILTTWKLKSIAVLSFFQNWVLFFVGAAAEMLASRTTASSRSASPNPNPAPTPGDGAGAVSTAPAAVAATVSEPLVVPTRYRVLLGITLAGNVFFTNVASALLTYPVQVILKSSKLLITMMMRGLVFGKRNLRVDYAAACLLSAGLVGFVMPHDYFDGPAHAHADAGSSPANPAAASGLGELDMDEGGAPAPGSPRFIMGLGCICVALVCESGMYILEDNVLFTRYKVSHTFIMREGYMYGGLVHIAGIVITGDAANFVTELLALDARLVGLLCVFPVILGVGVSFQLRLIQAHGSVVATACQVFRKIVSVVLSMLLFDRTFGGPALVGALLVCGSLVVKAAHKVWGIPCLVEPPHQSDATKQPPGSPARQRRFSSGGADELVRGLEQQLGVAQAATPGTGGLGSDDGDDSGDSTSERSSSPAASDQLLNMLPGVSTHTYHRTRANSMQRKQNAVV